MSLIKLQGNASGTGAFTIAAPNGNTDRTLTLPDATGTVVTADGSGNIATTSITPSAGIYLGGSGSANLLDDYEEGTWTPVLYGHATPGTWSPTSTNGGGYVKIGNQVTCWINASGALSGASGDMQVSGLPFANAPSGTAGRQNAVYSTGALQYWDGAARMVMGPLVPPETTTMYFHTYSAVSTGSSSGTQPPVVNSNHNIHAFVTYMVS